MFSLSSAIFPLLSTGNMQEEIFSTKNAIKLIYVPSSQRVNKRWRLLFESCLLPIFNRENFGLEGSLDQTSSAYDGRGRQTHMDATLHPDSNNLSANGRICQDHVHYTAMLDTK